MAWTAYVRLDADKDDVGTAIAVWNEGQADEFRYSRRARVDSADANAFKAEAEVARDAAIAKAALEASLKVTLEGILNG